MNTQVDSQLSHRILILFIITTSVLILQGVYNIFSLDGVNDSISKVHGSVTQVSATASTVSSPISELRQLTMNLVMAPSKNLKIKIKQNITEYQQQITRNLNDESLVKFADEESRELLLAIQNTWRNYSKAVDITKSNSDEGVRIAEFLNITINEKHAYEQVIKSIENYNLYQVTISDDIYADAQEKSVIAFWAVVITTVIEAVTLKIILAYVLNLVKRYVDSKKQHALELEGKNEALESSISELQELQEQLIESEKIAALNKVVAGLAHEINTPLGISITASSFLEEQRTQVTEKLETETLTSKGLTEFLISAEESNLIIIRNLKKADTLIQRFKNLSSENITTKETRFNLKSKIEDILLMIKPNIRHMSTEVICPENIDIVIDPSSIYHIISNLVLNSQVHAFGNNATGSLKIEALAQDDENIIISISDDGKGISQENIHRIFEPFYTTRRQFGGTGLGLAIVFNTLKQIGGGISCDSELNKGTTFTITLKAQLFFNEKVA